MDLTVQGDVCAPIYCHAEMMSFTDASEGTLRKWIANGSLELGTRNAIGRINYSLLDMLKIRLITSLCVKSRVHVTDATDAAEFATDWLAENINGQACNASKSCLIVCSDHEPRIALDSAELEAMLNESQGATVIRLSKFLDTALNQNTTPQAA